METRISGIPCIVRITEYHKGQSSRDSDWDNEDYVEFEVLDRRGRLAPWLANKLTPMDELRITNELLEAM